MKGLFENRGTTLLEITIAIAIIGILTVSFFRIFSTSITNVFTAGNQSTAIFEAQEAIETSSGESFEIEYELDGEKISVVGIIKEEEVEYNGGSARLKTFIGENKDES